MQLIGLTLHRLSIPLVSPFTTSNDTGTALPPSTGDTATVLRCSCTSDGRATCGVIAWFLYDTKA